MSRPRVLLVDNYDSSTGSLEQLIWEVSGARPHLVQADSVDLSALGAYTHIVLGPGPGNPHEPADVGRAFALLVHARGPVLGVCRGVQEMIIAAGGAVVRAPHPAR
ncbi:MAG: glutamine amidotransferase-related protein, partial [Candidatus Microbacterium stercoravium]